MRHLAVTVLALFLLAPPQCRAQEDTARRYIEEGLALAAAGDTAAAITEFRAAVDAAPRLAEAQFQLGKHLTRYISGDETDREDDEAEKALERANRLDPANPEIYVELGLLRLKQQQRDNAERILGRAVNMAEKQEPQDSALIADAYTHLAYTVELTYDRQRDRYMIPLSSGPISVAIPSSQRIYRYVQDYMEDAHPIPGFGDGTRRRLIGYYRRALEYQPTHFQASRMILLHLYDVDEIAEYLVVANRLVGAHPDGGYPQLYLGLGLHAVGQEDKAAEAFNRALDLLPDREIAAFLDVGTVMRRPRAEAYYGLDDSARTEFEEIYWRMGDPLYLTVANERHLEHMSRVAYADLRFAEPSVDLRGWDTERGTTYIRYGPPEKIASFPLGTSRREQLSAGAIDPMTGAPRAGDLQDGRSTTTGYTVVWVYERGFALMFHKDANYYHTTYAGEYQFVSDEIRHELPAKYDNIPSLPMMLPATLQIARFRGVVPENVRVEFHAEIPFENLLMNQEMNRTEVETGFFLVDGRGEQVLRRTESRVIERGDAASTNPFRTWSLQLPPTGRLVAAVEARDEVTWWAAAVRDTFTAETFPADSLAVSDILFAERLRPLAETPRRREDLDIIPNPSMSYATDQPVHLYYEIYDLEVDGQNFASYEVQLTVRVAELHREGMLANIIGDIADAWGFTIAGDDRVELRFAREADMTDLDRVAEYLSLDLDRAPPGTYEVTVKIWDRLAQKLVSRQRSFNVVADE
jgi:GWxTD domain-containing protein